MFGPCRKLTIVVMFVALGPPAAWGQSRSRHVWSSPSLQGIQGPASAFRQYSAGLGGLERASPYGGSGLLRSNITSVGNYSLRSRSSVGTGHQVTGVNVPDAPRGMSLKPISARISGRPSLGPVRSAFENPGLGSADGLGYYMAAMDQTSQVLAETDGPIASFVPTEPGLFQKEMAKCDRFFREGKYEKALSAGKKAQDMASRTPEVQLALLHVRFAKGEYNSAAHHLQMALKRLPELAMVDLKVRSFYDKPDKDKPDKFDEHVDKLEERMGEGLVNAQPEALLVLAYVSYFDGKDEEAAQALAKARVICKRDEKRQKANLAAIEAFTKSIGIAEKARAQPAPATQPAGGADGSDSRLPTSPAKPTGTDPGK